MSALTVREMHAPYPYVISEAAIRDLIRLLQGVPAPLGGTSVTLREYEITSSGNILSLEGLGKEVWEGVDPRKYVRELRDEWNAR
jgi:hypothetical protein